MKKETYVAEAPVTAGGMEITLLAKQSVTWSYLKGVWYFDLRKQPVYAVFSCNGRVTVTDMLGQEVPIDQARSEFPCWGSGPEGAASLRE